jgi:hypothetical protein
MALVIFWLFLGLVFAIAWHHRVAAVVSLVVLLATFRVIRIARARLR